MVFQAVFSQLNWHPEPACLDKRVGSEGGDGAHVDPSLHLHVAIVAPLCSPGVFDDPIARAIADNKDCMINIFNIACARLIDPMRVEHEALLGGIDGDRHGANSGDGFREGILISHGEVDVALVSGADGRIVESAQIGIKTLVGVADLGVYAVVFVDILEGLLREAAIAALAV